MAQPLGVAGLSAPIPFLQCPTMSHFIIFYLEWRWDEEAERGPPAASVITPPPVGDPEVKNHSIYRSQGKASYSYLKSHNCLT